MVTDSGHDQANKFVLSKEAYNTQNDTVVVFFQATATEGQYLLAYAQTDETKGKLASTSMDGNYIIANITTGAIEKSASTAVAPTVFVFENEKNEYQAEAAGHKIHYFGFRSTLCLSLVRMTISFFLETCRSIEIRFRGRELRFVG